MSAHAEISHEIPGLIEKAPLSERAYMFIAGGLGATHGLVGIEKAFTEVTKSKHIKVFNSILSMDKPNPERHQQQSEFIKNNLDAGREVEVITHSMGNLECTRALTLILQRDPTYFNDPEKASRLTLNYTASSGFNRGVIHEVKFLAKYVALGGAVNRGINAAVAFPPKNMTTGELTDGLRLIFHKKKPTDIVMEPFNPQDDNYKYLPDKIKFKLEETDTKLKDLLEKKKRWRARRILKKRGKIVKNELQEVFDAKHVVGNDLPVSPDVNFVYLARQPQVRKAFREMVSKSIYVMTRELINKGVNLKVVTFEHDRAITRKSVDHFINNTASDSRRGEVTMIELFGHSSLVLQPHNYIDAVTKLHE